MPAIQLNEYEKIRLRLKIMWEGGLEGYIDYGVATCLYNKFQKQFDALYKKRSNKKIIDLKHDIEQFLDGNIDSMNMKSIDFNKYNALNFDVNDYNYILN